MNENLGAKIDHVHLCVA